MPKTKAKDTGRWVLTYTEEVGNRICDMIAEGRSLVTITSEKTRAEGMPGYRTVMSWLQSDEAWAEAFRENYIQARQDQAEYHAGEIVDIADEACEDTVAVQRNRLRVEARKWTAAKLLPQKYGERVEVKIDASSLPPPQVIVNIVNAPQPKQIEDTEDAEVIEVRQVTQ